MDEDGRLRRRDAREIVSTIREALAAEENPEDTARRSRFSAMRQDAARFVPLMARCRQERSIWETKVLLPRNDDDDGRPILFRENHGMQGLHCIVGGKIDNVFDILEALETMRCEGRL